MKMYKDYDENLNEKEGKASRKRALIQSIKKWTMLSTVPAIRLELEHHRECALCERYHIDGNWFQCSYCCPLHKIGKRCNGGSPYVAVFGAFNRWKRNRSVANFRQYRKAARAMLAALQEAYEKLYGEKWEE